MVSRRLLDGIMSVVGEVAVEVAVVAEAEEGPERLAVRTMK